MSLQYRFIDFVYFYIFFVSDQIHFYTFLSRPSWNKYVKKLYLRNLAEYFDIFTAYFKIFIYLRPYYIAFFYDFKYYKILSP